MAQGPILNQLNLVVADMQATLAFYRCLGLDIPPDAGRAAGGHHVEVEMPGGVHLDFDSQALARAYDAGWSPLSSGGARGVIGFAVASREEVDTRYAAIVNAGYAGLQEAYDAFWGARYAIVRDPDGRHVGLMSPIAESRRSAPPPLG